MNKYIYGEADTCLMLSIADSNTDIGKPNFKETINLDTMKDQIAYYEEKLRYEFDSWDVYDLLNRGEKIIVIDTRTAEAYEKEHIPGAINIPQRTMTAENTAGLSKEFLYVTYCDGIGCNASTKGALKLVKLGFNIKELVGGIDWWKRDGYETLGTHATAGSKVICEC
jgi:rhodanese-related sulfurtransferase